jgi:hypothetical protein
MAHSWWEVQQQQILRINILSGLLQECLMKAAIGLRKGEISIVKMQPNGSTGYSLQNNTLYIYVEM